MKLSRMLLALLIVAVLAGVAYVRQAAEPSGAKMAEAAWLSASGVSVPRTRADTNSDANKSPVPFGLIGSFGVPSASCIRRGGHVAR